MGDYQKSTIEFISLAEGSGSYTQASCFLEWDLIMKYILKCICINNLKGTNSLLSQSNIPHLILGVRNQCPTSEEGWEQSIDKV